MIPVIEQNEPDSFHEKVRIKGQQFLKSNSFPDKLKDYWRFALNDLYSSYNKICAYSAIWCKRSAASVDHYIPKNVNYELAYEWTNYRLADRHLNSYKNKYQDVVDPFKIKEGAFELIFPSLRIIGGPNLCKSKANLTINRLKLNSQMLIEERGSYLKEYCKGETTFSFLTKKAPFIAFELKRQNLIENIQLIMGYKKKIIKFFH